MAKTYTEEQMRAAIAEAIAVKKKLSVEYKDPAKQYTFVDRKTKKEVTEAGKGTVVLKGLRQMGIAYYPGEWDVIFSPEVMAMIKAQCKAVQEAE